MRRRCTEAEFEQGRIQYLYTANLSSLAKGKLNTTHHEKVLATVRQVSVMD